MYVVDDILGSMWCMCRMCRTFFVFWVIGWCVCPSSVSVKRDGTGGTEVSVEITCEEEEKRPYEIGA